MSEGDLSPFDLSPFDLSPFDTSHKLNEMPMTYLRYRTPRKAFRALDVEQLGLAG